MTPDTWKLVASLGGVFFIAVTVPMICAISAELRLLSNVLLRLGKIEDRLEGIDNKIGVVHGERITRLEELNRRFL